MSTEELWFWKVEPCSPPLDSDSASVWSLHENDVVDEAVAEQESAVVPTRATLAQQLLDDIEEYVKKEESFSDWFEDKVQLPNFDDIQTTLPVEPLPLQPLQTPVAYKAEQNLTFILGHGHLTPPQSPPAVDISYQQPVFVIQEQPSYVTLLPTQPDFTAEQYVLPPQTSGDLEREMAVVDEVVRGVAQQWEAWESTDTSSRSSESTEDSDPEWCPQQPAPTKTTSRRPRQSRPYSVEDRRQRKKEQNKTAATRYRLKKKAEVHVIVEEEHGLEDQKAVLEDRVVEVTREINYLKGLMREMFKAKGMLK